MTPSALENRLLKNFKKLRSWTEREVIEAYRLYEKDIPEYPYVIDIYKNYCVVYDKGKPLDDSPENDVLLEKHYQEVSTSLKNVMKVSDDQIIFKRRERMKGAKQYEIIDQRSDEIFIVREGLMNFEVNLKRYLDTGLFLDHRPLRKRLLKICKGKRVLNLFAYTGSLSVAAALAGGQITTMDMSNTYIDWSRRNFEHNMLNPKGHRFIVDDVLKGLKELQKTKELFDIILLDPPTFSNSKSMDTTFEVERDQIDLIEDCMKVLFHDGLLIFSNNKKSFKLAERINTEYDVHDVTKESIPIDFRNQKAHHCFEIQYKDKTTYRPKPRWYLR